MALFMCAVLLGFVASALSIEGFVKFLMLDPAAEVCWYISW